MPSGPEGFVEEPEYSEELERARELLLAHPGRWRVIYHYDGDGIASASCAVRALERLGNPFQATPLLAVERARMKNLLAATEAPVWVVDTGASWLDLFAEHPHPVLVLDHHQYPRPSRSSRLPAKLAFVNPMDWGVDGMSELCAASLTWLFTAFLDPRNWDNAPWGLSGAIADRQHVGGFKGLNARLVEEAVQRELVVPRRGLGLRGPSLVEALERSVDPFVRGVSGHREGTARFLRSLGLDPDAPVSALDPENDRRLASALVTRLVAQGVRPEFCDAFRAETYVVPSLGLDAEELSTLQNASGRIGEPGVGVALALGDERALERARSAEESWRAGVLRGLKRIEAGELRELGPIQWFESPETSLAGTQAGLAMTYLADPTRPTFVFSRGDSLLKVSGRGTLWLVSQGLDLAQVCRDAAAHVGGEGGGHRVAAGASIPLDARDAFLAEAARAVGAQLPRTVRAPAEVAA
jgi:single-stranded-DNA-specific exonuclease